MDNKPAPIPSALMEFVSDGTPQAVCERYASLKSVAELSDFGELDRNLVVIDTETTGFSFNHDELTQIAAARLECGQITDWFVTFVNPGKPIPEDVAYLTNIHDEDVADAPTPQKALADLVEFVGDAKLVAHNADFDRTFATRHPEGYPLLENVWIDSLDLARITLPRLRSHRLLDLVRAFECPLSTHRADADVEATCAIFRILLAAVASMPPALTCEIARMAPADQWPTVVVFQAFEQAYREEAQAGAQAAPGDGPTAAAPAAADVWDEGAALGETFGDVSRETLAADAESAAGGAAAGVAGPDVESADAFDAPPALRPADLRFSMRSLRAAHLKGVDFHPKAADLVDAGGPDTTLDFPTSEDLDEAFSKEGLVGAMYPDFETRSEQLAMAQAVRRAFELSENLAVEAGTGVGKSMAYLVPAALTARKNDIAVGVATKTNALLDQLVYHELPALSDAFSKLDPEGGPLTFAPLKGFANYPCIRKIENLVRDGVGMRVVQKKEVSQAPALAALLSFVEQTAYDDIHSLKIDYRALPRYLITTKSQDCLRHKCPFYGAPCFVFGSRLQAESADIVVTNHSLLFRDVAADGGLLPPIRYWVIDEAHNAEAEARGALSLELDAEVISGIARRVASDEATRNVFVRAERKAASDAQGGMTPVVGLAEKARSVGRDYAEKAARFCEALKMLLFFDDAKHGRNYETVELWINPDLRTTATFAHVRATGAELMAESERLIHACQELVGCLEDVEGMAAVQREIASLALTLKDHVQSADLILNQVPEGYAYAAVLNRKKDKVVDKLQALLLDVGDRMNETFFSRTNSVVMTSATLTVDNSFETFGQAVGCNRSDASRTRTLQLESSYDFDSAMTIYVVEDMPEPTQRTYMKALEELVVLLHQAQQGSMLTLFTNRREMEQCYEAVQPVLKQDDLRLVCQKWNVSVKGLRDDFMRDERLSLFALKSFWEGFDAPGSTLKGVIVPKLPFSKPSDPLSCERAARDDQAWRHYVLPAAVLETKQAAGRLIRKADDEGILVLADKRLLTKSYGKVFLRSMPSRTVKVLPMRKIAEEVARKLAE